MFNSKFYLSVQDLHKLQGMTEGAAYKLHQRIRRALSTRLDENGEVIVKPNLTLREYCRYMQEDFEDVVEALGG